MWRQLHVLQLHIKVGVTTNSVDLENILVIILPWFVSFPGGFKQQNLLSSSLVVQRSNERKSFTQS